MAEDNFSRARLLSKIATDYQVKQTKNQTSYNLVVEYLKNNGKLKNSLYKEFFYILLIKYLAVLTIWDVYEFSLSYQATT